MPSLADVSALVPISRISPSSKRYGAARAPNGIEGLDAEAQGQPLSRRPAQRPLVQMEARRTHPRLRADVCAARIRQALVLLFRLYVRRLEDGDKLVPVGKAYSGFTDEELLRLDRWIRNNTVERFGPVRAVTPGLVLEVAFDAVHPSAGTNPASRCAFRASIASAGTSPPPRPTRLRRSRN